MDFDDLDYDRLRSDLMDNYGTAMCSGFPMAVMDLGKVERASESELLQIAHIATGRMMGEPILITKVWKFTIHGR